MIDRIYPNWQQIANQHQPLSEGETALLKYLDQYLPKDENWNPDIPLSEYNGWLIFSQPFLNGKRPDIIVFNPNVGCVIIEVKDWDLNNYHWKTITHKKTNYHDLYVNTKQGQHCIKNPIKQVKHYKDIIIGQLVPLIGEKADRIKNAYGLIKTSLYFHKHNTKDVFEFFDNKYNKKDPISIFGCDYLTSSNNIVLIIRVINQRQNKLWDTSWNKELLWWLMPPFHSIEQGKVLKLTSEQEPIAEPAPGHYRVKGVAGSGKTQVLAYRAAKIASEGYKVLIITFNMTLWHYIRDMISRARFEFSWDRIRFDHFHGFCKDILNELGVDWPRSNDSEDEESESEKEILFRDIVPKAVINALALDANNIVEKYDAILIDEGQDYYIEWYSLLSNYFLSSRDEMLVVVDKKQNIYQRQTDWFDKRSQDDLLNKFKPGIMNLNKSLRLTKRISNFANEFCKEFLIELGNDIKCDQSQELQYDHIVWKEVAENVLMIEIYNAYEMLKNKDQSASDIAILLPGHEIGFNCVKYFEERNIKVNHVFEQDENKRYHPNKKSFWMGDGRLKMSTIHSFKGWEISNVIIYIPSDIGQENKTDMMIYTAITRSMKNIIILNACKRYSSFGKRFPKEWNNQY